MATSTIPNTLNNYFKDLFKKKVYVGTIGQEINGTTAKKLQIVLDPPTGYTPLCIIQSDFANNYANLNRYAFTTNASNQQIIDVTIACTHPTGTIQSNVTYNIFVLFIKSDFSPEGQIVNV